jgi:hypothetical protein
MVERDKINSFGGERGLELRVKSEKLRVSSFHF